MSTNTVAITPDSKVLQVLTAVPEKFVVDYANGIDVARDHLRVQQQRHSFFNRLMDGMTGKSSRRQAEINANLINGVEASLKWLTQLTNDVARSHLAIARVNDRVSALSQDLVQVASYSIDTRKHLDALKQQLNQQISALSQEVERIGFNQQVIMHIDQVFSKWEAGRFAAFSPAGSCYAAMEELRWGPFGHYMLTQTGSERNNFLRQVEDRSIVLMAKDAQVKTSERISVDKVWLKQPANQAIYPDFSEALAYLATNLSIQRAPMVATITQALPERLVQVPVVSAAGRIAEQIVSEVFEEPLYA